MVTAALRLSSPLIFHSKPRLCSVAGSTMNSPAVTPLLFWALVDAKPSQSASDNPPASRHVRSVNCCRVSFFIVLPPNNLEFNIDKPYQLRQRYYLSCCPHHIKHRSLSLCCMAASHNNNYILFYAGRSCFNRIRI